jgi:acetyltransferase-like isoleucine patch superfamily enzyme
MRALRRHLAVFAGSLADSLASLAGRMRAQSLLSRCMEAGANVRLRMPILIYHPEKLRLGSDVDIGEYVVIRASGGVSIGDRVLIATGAAVVSTGHPVAPPRFRQVISKPIAIGDDVWIGANAVVLPGVAIGSGSVVAAGAVVTRDVPALCVVAGVPARIIRRIAGEREKA